MATAVTRYQLQPEWNRPELAGDVTRMNELLCGTFGYQQVLIPGFGPDPTAQQLHASLRGFARSCDPDDYVVLYLTGHGDFTGRGEHILLPSDTDPDDVLGQAVKTADLAEWMLDDTPLRRLMVILDTCYAGGPALAGRALDAWSGRGSVVVVTATRPHQQAQPGAFTQAFTRAVHNRAVAGYATPALPADAIVGQILKDAAVPATQTATCVQLGAGEDLRFLPNPDFQPHLVDLDLDTQERLRHLGDQELAGRFVPATRWFTGRHRALTDLTAWLNDPGGAGRRRCQVVTGGPGSGKTAVLGLLAALSDPRQRPAVPIDGLPAALPGSGAIDAAIYAGTLPTASVLDRIAAAAGIQWPERADRTARIRDLLDVLARRDRPLVVLVDALDEAADPQDLVTNALRPLIDRGPDRLRLLLGTRPHLLASLGPYTDVLDLDDDVYADPASVRAYARRVLLQSHTRSPYRSAPGQVLGGVTDAVGAAAGKSFLVARIIAQSLAAMPQPADPTDTTWRNALPTTAGEAMHEDLATRLGPRASTAAELLLPLAYAQGAGMPWEGIWPQLANALTPARAYTDTDVQWLRDHAGSYVIEGTEADRTAYRLFHQSLVEHLRQGRDQAADQAALARSLTACVPPGGGRRDWTSAHPYIRAHLATHAARGNQLDDLLTDPGYLLAAGRPQLLAALPHAVSDQARANADAYHRAAFHLAGKPAPEHASYLELAARCTRAPQLADAIAATWPDRPWSTRWASWLFSEAPHRALTGHTGGVMAVAVAVLEGRPVVVSGSDDHTVRVWDLATGTPVGAPFTGHTDGVMAVAVAVLEGRPVVVSGSWDDTVRVWDLATGTPVGDPFTGHTSSVSAVAVAELEGRPVVVSGSIDDTVRVWDLATGTPVGDPFTGHTAGVRAVAVAVLEGRPVVVSGSIDDTVRVWDLATGTPVGAPFTGHTHYVRAVAVAVLEGRPVVVSGGGEGTVRVWDLATGTPVGAPFTAHTSPVSAVAVAVLEGRPVVVSGSDDHTVRGWDLATGTPVGDPFTAHTSPVSAVAVAVLEGRPVVVSGSWDWTVRVWDLATRTPVGAPFTGHTSPVSAVAVAVLEGRPVVVSGSDDSTVRVWDLATGTLVGAPFTAHTSSVSAVAVAVLEGRPVVVSGSWDDTVRVWDLATRTPVGAPFTGHTSPVSAVAVGVLEGRPVVVSGGGEGTVRVWDLATGTLVGAPFTAHTSSVSAVAVAVLEGRPVVVSGSWDDTVRVWDLATRTPVGAPFTGHTSSVSAVAVGVLEGRPVVVSGSWDDTVRVWDLATRTPVGAPFTAHTSSVSAVAVAVLEGRPVVVSGGDDSTVRVWDLATGTPVGDPFTGHTHYVSAVAVGVLEGRPVVVSGSIDHTVRVWDLATGTPVGAPFTGHISPVRAVAVAVLEGRPVVVSGGDDSTVRVWDLATGTPVGAPFTGHTHYVSAVAVGVLEGRPVVVSGGGEGTVRVWDLATGTPVGDPFTGHISPVRAVAVAVLEGRPVVVSGGDDSTVRVWDLATGTPVGAPFTGHTHYVSAVAVAVLEGRPVVVSGSIDQTVRVWDLATRRAIGRQLGTLDGTVTAVNIAAIDNRPTLFAGTASGTVVSWQLTRAAVRPHAWRARLHIAKWAPTTRWHYGDQVHALAYSRQPNRMVIGHGPVIQTQAATGTSLIELDATVLALATAPPDLIIATTTQGIMFLDVP